MIKSGSIRGTVRVPRACAIKLSISSAMVAGIGWLSAHLLTDAGVVPRRAASSRPFSRRICRWAWLNSELVMGNLWRKNYRVQLFACAVTLCK